MSIIDINMPNGILPEFEAREKTAQRKMPEKYCSATKKLMQINL